MRRWAARLCPMARPSGSGRRAPRRCTSPEISTAGGTNAASRMAPIGGGHWASFVPGLKDGDQYLFYVEGLASSGFKRDPRARLLTFQPAFPACNSVLRNAAAFPGTGRSSCRPISTTSSSISFMSAPTRSCREIRRQVPRRDLARAPSRRARRQCDRAVADPGIPDRVQHGLQRHRPLQPRKSICRD